MWIVVLVPLAVVGVLAGVWVLVPLLLPISVFYQQGKPTRLGRMANRAAGLYAALGGPPSWQVRLETRGRRTGRRSTTPVVIARHEGKDYLVSMLGERSAWVRNVRAAGGEVVLRHGRKRRVLLEEVPAGDRAPMLKAYVQRATSGRRHFTLKPDSSVAEFEAVADQYPVFQIVQADEARSRALDELDRDAVRGRLVDAGDPRGGPDARLRV